MAGLPCRCWGHMPLWVRSRSTGSLGCLTCDITPYYQHLLVMRMDRGGYWLVRAGMAAGICSGDEGVEKFRMSGLPSYAWYRSRSGSLGTSLDVERPTSKK